MWTRFARVPISITTMLDANEFSFKTISIICENKFDWNMYIRELPATAETKKRDTWHFDDKPTQRMFEASFFSLSRFSLCLKSVLKTAFVIDMKYLLERMGKNRLWHIRLIDNWNHRTYPQQWLKHSKPFHRIGNKKQKAITQKSWITYKCQENTVRNRLEFNYI